MKSSFAISATLAAVVVTQARAEDLRIASWNIANLGAPGTVLRGYDRADSDYDELKIQITELDADIIALQEIGSIAALKAVLPGGYKFKFETRCYDNANNCETDVEDIFKAIAVRETLTSSFFQIDSLAIPHQNECGDEPRKVRGGVGVDITHNGNRYLVPSLHIKATCKDDEIEAGTEDDCATQREQIKRLRAWMDTQANDAAIILTGDFNRKILNGKDSIRDEFFGSLAKEAFLPNADTRTCWSKYNFDFGKLASEARSNNPKFKAENAKPWMFTPKSNTEIDFFIVEGLKADIKIAAEQVQMAGEYVFRDAGHALEKCDGSLRKFSETDNRVLTFAEAYPSDHCPIVMNLTAN